MVRCQTVQWSNLSGDHVATLCTKHSGVTEQAQADNAQYSHHRVSFKGQGDWRDAPCDNADYVTPAEHTHGHHQAICY